MTASAAQARTAARDAYLALFPLVTAYGLLYTETVDPASPTYAGGFGRWSHQRSVVAVAGYRPTARTILGSSVWLDVTSGPWVLSTPSGVGRDRRALVLTDLWGSTLLRVLGRGASSVVVMGPSRMGGVPAEAESLVRGTTRFVRAEVTVELDEDLDRDRALRLQRQCRARPAGAQHRPPDDGAPDPSRWWSYRPGIESTLAFWPLANFALTLVAEDRDHRALWERAAVIGVGPGRPWDERGLEPEIVDSIGAGMDDALSELLRSARSRPDGELPPSRAAARPDLIERALDALRSNGPVDERS
jgi:hypothetical protein